MTGFDRYKHVYIFAAYLAVLGLFGLLGWYVQNCRCLRWMPRVGGPAIIANYRLERTLLRQLFRQEKVVIGPGTVIGDYLEKYGVTSTEAQELILSVRPVYDLARIRAGQMLEFALSGERLLQGFKYHIDEDSFLQVERKQGRWQAEKKTYPFEWRECVVEGTIRDNLFNEIERAGEKPTLAVELADLFAWDVDFYADLRTGDRFRIYFEKKYLDGAFTGYGAIRAAEFVNQGQVFRAVRYVFPDGHSDYFTPDGQSIRKELLKSPLKMGIITSRFSFSRFHPTLKIYRPHFGVDIAAPIGTPVHAAGDGAITFMGFNGQAGRMVEIRHPNRYLTQYLHLSRFGEGLRIGSAVHQGDVVGYVGESGEATGPHLDYRIKVAGTYVNPLKQQFERATPLPAAHLAEFQAVSFNYLRILTTAGPLRDYYEALLRQQAAQGSWPRQLTP